ncbi:MAG: hypothetical protein LBR41_00455 [Rickettsiales bacterium]|jgi:hypothetical protein|nr:hypothetical protein [Rickettsiales bacterium]
MSFQKTSKYKIAPVIASLLTLIACEKNGQLSEMSEPEYNRTGIMSDTHPSFGPFASEADFEKPLHKSNMYVGIQNVNKESFQDQNDGSPNHLNYANHLALDLNSADTVFIQQYLFPFYRGNMTYDEFSDAWIKLCHGRDPKFYKVNYVTNQPGLKGAELKLINFRNLRIATSKDLSRVH